MTRTGALSRRFSTQQRTTSLGEGMEAVSLGRLESHLWASANILRGPVDATDFKTCIFPLLFFKPICDVWEEEYQAALAKSNGDLSYAKFAENHHFQIPAGAHWNDVRQKPKNVGATIQKAMRAIETANPDLLTGIFGDAAWTSRERLPDETLKNLIEHFSTQTLSVANVPEDELGNAYEYLVKKLAHDSGHTAAVKAWGKFEVAAKWVQSLGMAIPGKSLASSRGSDEPLARTSSALKSLHLQKTPNGASQAVDQVKHNKIAFLTWGIASFAARCCATRPARRSGKTSPRLSTRTASRGTSTSRSRCARWRKSAPTSSPSRKKPRGCSATCLEGVCHE